MAVEEVAGGSNWSPITNVLETASSSSKPLFVEDMLGFEGVLEYALSIRLKRAPTSSHSSELKNQMPLTA